MDILTNIKNLELKIDDLSRQIMNVSLDLSLLNTDLKKHEEDLAYSKKTGIPLHSEDLPFVYDINEYGDDIPILNSKIQQLQSKKDNLEAELELRTKQLQDEQRKYKELYEPKLVIDNGKVYFAGDESKNDIFLPLLSKLKEYIHEFEYVKNSPEAKQYDKLANELKQFVANSNLPLYTDENIKEFDKYFVNNSFYSNDNTVGSYDVIDGKILVTNNYVESYCNSVKRELLATRREIESRRKQVDEFKLPFICKIFKFAGKKQKKQLHHLEVYLNLSINTAEVLETRLNNLNELQKKYYEPAIPGIKIAESIDELRDSSHIAKQYINNSSFYKEMPKYENIVKELVQKDYSSLITTQAKEYLKNNDLTLSKETVLETILSEDYFKHLVTHLENDNTDNQNNLEINIESKNSQNTNDNKEEVVILEM